MPAETYIRVKGTNFQYKATPEFVCRWDEMSEAQRTQYRIETGKAIGAIKSLTEEHGEVWNRFEKIEKITQWNKAAEAILTEMSHRVYGNRMDLAEKIYREKFIPLRHCEIQGALSPTEIQKVLVGKDRFLAFCSRFKSAAEAVQKVERQFKTIDMIRERYLRTKTMLNIASARPSADAAYRKPISEAAQMRKELTAAKEKMNGVIDLCNLAAQFAPDGMKDYIEFNLKVFIAADQAMKLIDKYAEKIESALEQIDKLFAQNNESTHTAQDGTNFGCDRNDKGMNDFIWPRNR